MFSECAAEFEGSPWEKTFADAAADLKFVGHVLTLREQGGETVLPADVRVAFEPFRLVAPHRVKVILVGELPTSSGLVFSLPRDAQTTPALKNVHKELARTVEGFSPPPHGDLSAWGEQGVLFLPISLTMHQSLRGDASGHGSLWCPFLNHVMTAVLAANPQVVFVSWGRKARDLFNILSLGNINRLDAADPSSAAFAGCDHFDKINRHLANRERMAVKKHGDAGKTFLTAPIDWRL